MPTQKPDSQIDAIYEHFENGKPAPIGVTLRGSFTKTMRWFVDQSDHSIKPM